MMMRFDSGTAARWDGDRAITPRMGRNWWFWLPRVRWNHGTWSDAVTDVSVSWLCGWCAVYVWWRSHNRGAS